MDEEGCPSHFTEVVLVLICQFSLIRDAIYFPLSEVRYSIIKAYLCLQAAQELTLSLLISRRFLKPSRAGIKTLEEIKII